MNHILPNRTTKLNGSVINHWLFKSCLIIVIWLLVIRFSPPASAQTLSLTISPPVTEIIMKPNTSLIQSFTLQNQGESTQLTPRLALIRPKGLVGGVEIEPSPFEPSEIPLTLSLASDRLALNEPFFLKSGETAQLVLKLESASLSEPVDVYLALVLESTASDLPGNTTARGGISSLVLVTITEDGTIPLEIELGNFSPSPIHDSGTPLNLSPEVKNNAPIMLRPHGTFSVFSPSGKEIFQSALYPNLVLGESSRSLLLASENSANKEVLDPLPFSWQPSLTNFGPHRLTITLTTQGGTALAEESRIVWLLPIQLLIYFLLAIISLLILRSYRKQAI